MIRRSVCVGDAQIELETGRIARQAHGSIVARQGKAWLLATVVSGPTKEQNFLPMTVQYREMHAAAGRIPGNYLRRETRPAEHEVLTARLIDRMLRPLFPKGLRAEIQVTVTVYSTDSGVDLTTLALVAAGAALHLSDLPFAGPVAGLRVLRNSAGLHLPGHGKGDKADLDLIIAAGPDGVVMMEGTADQVGDIDIVIALESARGALEQALTEIDALRTEAGRAKRSYDAPPDHTPLANALGQRLSAALQTALAEPDKHIRGASLKQLRANAVAEHGTDASPAFDHAMNQHLREAALEGRRIGGRALDEVRPIDCEAGLLPANHGSALFTRGETQVLVSATLGSHRDARDQERLTGGTKERFMLHYNFPGFSVGEARAHRGPGRRELGHGRLAHRALASVMPDNAQFPYTVRVVSDVTESNGSSSMATVCGGTLALMDAGVPITEPVSGIAMGLIKEGDKIAVLTDILGDEDHLGDMDFKVAGTETGITTLQLDNKLGVLPTSVLAEALAAAATARRHILSEMHEVLEAQSGQPSEAAPQHARVKINPSRIGALIGTGGRNLQALQNKTKAKIEVNQDGTVLIFGRDAKSTEAAIKAIEQVSAELRKDGLYLGTVVSMKDFGAFVRIGELEALVHVSELDTQRVTDPTTVVSIGDEVLVKVLGTDSRGRVKLSRRAALGSDKADAINA